MSSPFLNWNASCNDRAEILGLICTGTYIWMTWHSSDIKCVCIQWATMESHNQIYSRMDWEYWVLQYIGDSICIMLKRKARFCESLTWFEMFVRVGNSQRQTPGVHNLHSRSSKTNILNPESLVIRSLLLGACPFSHYLSGPFLGWS